MNITVKDDLINYANLKKLYMAIKFVYSRQKKYNLNMIHYTTVSGIPTDEDFNNECNSSCCAIGYAMLAGIGDTEKYINRSNVTYKINYTKYSNNELVGKFCNIYIDDEAYLNIWSYLFASYHADDYDGLLIRLDTVINKRWDDAVKHNFHNILKRTRTNYTEPSELKNQNIDSIIHFNVEKDLLDDLISFFKISGYNTMFNIRLNDQILSKETEIKRQLIGVFGYKFNMFDILEASYDITQTLTAIKTKDTSMFHQSITIGS